MSKKLFFLLFLLGSCLFTLTNCAKDNELTTLNYKETKCADAWRTNEGDSEETVKTAFTDYLENELNISFGNYKMTFDEEAVQFCEACSCTTGRVITITVDEGAVPELEEIGFK